jgi:hypothetical protein
MLIYLCMEGSSQPIIQPVQTTPPVRIPVPKAVKPFKYLIYSLLGLIVVIGLVFTGVQIGKRQTESPKPMASPSPTALPTPPSEAQKSTMTSVDEVWNIYTNNSLGFSMKIPKVASEFGGVCVNGKQDVGMIPVRVFDDDKGAYITFESFYEYPVNNTCQKVVTDLGLIEKRANQWKSGNGNSLFVPSNWHIITQKVVDDTELEEFIKESYGTGCKLGTKTLTTPGVYDVKVMGDGLDLDATKCPINFVLAVKYSPEFKKVATWGVGQGIVFSSSDFKVTYDMEMVNSFKFLN